MKMESAQPYETMTTKSLKSILRKSLTDGEIPVEDVLVVSDILRKRDAGKGKGPPDTEAAWNQFVKNNLSPLSDSPSENVASSIHKRRHIYQKCAIFAICTVTVFSVMITARAFGMDVIGTIVRWTADIFHYEIVSRETDGFEGTHLENFDFTNSELPGEFIPGWTPHGLKRAAARNFSGSGFQSILIEYAGENDSFLNIIFTQYDSAEFAEGRKFEKQSPDVETYFVKDKIYVLTPNGKSDFWTAAWSDGPLVFQITGTISKQDLIHILNALGGTT